jgi:hypothetical protein
VVGSVANNGMNGMYGSLVGSTSYNHLSSSYNIESCKIKRAAARQNEAKRRRRDKDTVCKKLKKEIGGNRTGR